MSSRSSISNFFKRVGSITGAGSKKDKDKKDDKKHDHPTPIPIHSNVTGGAGGSANNDSSSSPDQTINKQVQAVQERASLNREGSLKKPPSFFKQIPGMRGSDLSSGALLPPALTQKGEVSLVGRPPAASIGGSVIERYWALSDVLEDKDIILSWRLRIMMCHDAAKALKKLHDGDIAHMRLFLDAFLVNQNIRLVLHDNGGMLKTKDENEKKRDVLFFGSMMCQIALHQSLDLGGTVPRRSVRSVSQAEIPTTKLAHVAGIPDEDYEHLKTLFSAELAGTETTTLQDSIEFQDKLATQVRKMAGFHAKESEKIPMSAIQSFEELVVQCCSPIPGNRPEFTAIEDWLSAIVDDVGGKSLSQDDYKERDGVLWVLQPKETEMLGDVQTTDESNLFNVTILDAVVEDVPSGNKNKNGYESEDSFNPKDDDIKRERRPSRLMQFIESTPSENVEKLRDSDSNQSDSHSARITPRFVFTTVLRPVVGRAAGAAVAAAGGGVDLPDGTLPAATGATTAAGGGGAFAASIANFFFA